MKNEVELILLGCLCKRSEEEKEKLEALLKEQIDWIWVVGQLMRHRLVGYFHNNIGRDYRATSSHIKKDFILLSKDYEIINRTNLSVVSEIFEELGKRGVQVAGLKGLVYNMSIYPLGVRRSNDIDLLVKEKDLKIFDVVMREFGFIQTLDGSTEATKKQKLVQIMNYHDLVPYIKKIDNEIVESIKVDVNFQFDTKDNEVTEEIMKYGFQNYSKEGFCIQGLRWETHLAHLCVHFYREASNSLWVDTGRDLDMYKIIDIENTIRQFSEEQMVFWVDVVKKFGLEKPCFFTLYYLNEFYTNEIYERVMDLIGIDDRNYINQVKKDVTQSYTERKIAFVYDVFGLSED